LTQEPMTDFEEILIILGRTKSPFSRADRMKKMGKIGTTPIIIDRLSRCIYDFCMPRISRVVVIGFPHHPT